MVALLAEDLGGLGKSVGRQLLRTRRSFTATVFSPDGEPDLERILHSFAGAKRNWNCTFPSAHRQSGTRERLFTAHLWRIMGCS